MTASHDLPSARSQGEPLTGRLNPPAGSLFMYLIAGSPEDWLILASDAGYGFRVQLKELASKNKAGKTVLTLPKGSSVLIPATIQNDSDRVAVVTKQGRLLVFVLTELPILNRGKGNKLIQIPTKDLADNKDKVVSIVSLPEGHHLRVLSGKRHLTLKAADIQNYTGTRARRGSPLPRGFQRVDKLQVE